MKSISLFWIAPALLAVAGCHRLHPTLTQPAPTATLNRSDPVYTVQDLGVLPGCDSSYGNGINAHGWVVGDMRSYRRGANYGFVFRHGALTGLTYGAQTSSARAINERGEITGWISRPHSPPMNSITALFYSQGKPHPLGSLEGLPESHGFGLNDKGEVVGDMTDGDVSYAFLYSHGKMQYLGKSLPEAGYNSGSAINRGEKIVGQTDVFNDKPHAVLFTRKKIGWREQAVSAPPGWRFLSANAINEAGWIAGSGSDRSSLHGYLFRAGRVIDLGALPGDSDSEVLALNNRNQVVGRSAGHAFLYAHGKITDLNALIDAKLHWTLLTANGINDKGQIVGTGKHDGKTRAFVLTPLTRYK